MHTVRPSYLLVPGRKVPVLSRLNKKLHVHQVSAQPELRSMKAICKLNTP